MKFSLRFYDNSSFQTEEKKNNMDLKIEIDEFRINKNKYIPKLEYKFFLQTIGAFNLSHIA